MFEVEFSGYKSSPGEVRTSTPNEFGMPRYKVDGEHPTKITLTGLWNGGKIDEVQRNHLTDWFFNKCLAGMCMDRREVVIDTELPEELWQWYVAAERINKREMV